MNVMTRLTALDATLLAIGNAQRSMHVTTVSLLAPDPPGALSEAVLRAELERRVALQPRLGQVLASVPAVNHPVLLDATDRFDVTRHFERVTSSPTGSPDDAELKQLAARIHAEPLDLTCPLWKEWYVDGGPGGGRSAIISKVHQALLLSEAELAPVASWPLSQRDPRAQPAAPGGLLGRELGRYAREWPSVSSRLFRRDAAQGSAGVPRSARYLFENTAPPVQPGGKLRDDAHASVDWLTLDPARVERLMTSAQISRGAALLALVIGGLARIEDTVHHDGDVRAVLACRPAPDARFWSLAAAQVPLLSMTSEDGLHALVAELESARARGGGRALAVADTVANLTFVNLATKAALRAAAARAHELVLADIPEAPAPQVLGTPVAERYVLLPHYLDNTFSVAALPYGGGLSLAFSARLAPHDLAQLCQGIAADA